MPSTRLDSCQNSVQNGAVESFPALRATIFVNYFISKFYTLRASPPALCCLYVCGVVWRKMQAAQAYHVIISTCFFV